MRKSGRQLLVMFVGVALGSVASCGADPQGAVEEASANFDIEDVEPILRRISDLVESGFADEEVNSLASKISDQAVESEREYRYRVRIGGTNAELRVVVFMDDVDAPDIGVHGCRREVSCPRGRCLTRRCTRRAARTAAPKAIDCGELLAGERQIVMPSTDLPTMLQSLLAGTPVSCSEPAWVHARQGLLREHVCNVADAHENGYELLRQGAVARLAEHDAHALVSALSVLFVVGIASDAAAVEPLLEHRSEEVRKAARTCHFEIRRRPD
jgi:hypothetical protein